jgi:hypothetical protein
LFPVVKLLLDNHKFISDEIHSIFVAAAIRGHLEAVKYAVEHGADVWHYDEWSLGLLSTQGHIEVVEYIKSAQRGIK